MDDDAPEFDFLVQAVAPSGEVVATYAKGPDAAAAVERMTSEGYREIELYEDLPMPLVTQLNREESKRRKERPLPTPAASNSIASYTASPSVFRSVCERLSRPPYSMLAWVVVFVVAFTANASWWIIGALAALGVVIEVVGGSARIVDLYQNALVDTHYRRTTEALEKLAKLEANLIKNKQLGAVGTLEFASRRAIIHAVEGDVERGLSVLDRAHTEAGVPKWLALVREAMVYAAASEYDLAVEANERAVQLGPPSAVVLLDLAIQHTLRLENFERGAEFLQRAKALPIPVWCRPAVDLVEAALLLGRGDVEAADDALSRTESSDLLESMWTQEWVRNLAGVWRCLLEAKRGEIDEAVRTLDIYESVLRATGEDELIERCQRAIDLNRS